MDDPPRHDVRRQHTWSSPQVQDHPVSRFLVGNWRTST
jgi:hypothetical protein